LLEGDDETGESVVLDTQALPDSGQKPPAAQTLRAGLGPS
jgi:hypothetical protein